MTVQPGRTGTIDQIPARNRPPEGRKLAQVVEVMEQWEADHNPWDRQTKLSNFFVNPRPEQRDIALVPLQTTAMVEQGTAMPEFTLREHAMRQFCERLRIDYKDVFQRFIEMGDSAWLAHGFNKLVQGGHYDKDVLLRAVDGHEVRAMMSSQFQPFDNLEMLRMALPFVPEDSTVRWEFRDEMSLHVSVTFPHTQTVIREGDVFEQGIHLSNSEVGVRSVTVAAFAFVLRCWNGAIGMGGDGGFYRMRHAGSSERLGEAVGAAVHSATLESEGIIAKFKAGLEVEVDKPMDALTEFAKKGTLTQEMLKASLEGWAHEGGGNTLYDLAQGVTRGAQAFDGEDRYTMQREALNLLPS